MGNEDFPHLPTFDASDAQTYNALCHCGTVQYTVTLSPPLAQQKVVECNCSICSRNGYLLVYPLREQMVVKSGEEELRSYSFGIKRNLHKFCGRCGSAVFFDPRMLAFGESPDLLGINVRMFKDVKLDKLQIVHWDGWNKSRFIDSDHLQ
ncbi:hypothetical protein K458DRAFT_384125 [Lentithecium fluviatile CBS 122367]|uniref:CENP-V/GFA domain-containing protein n=1 Tax=Lentithecium fluviatile CBS 122367 TaxID=1168545 RepID=A0A6G1JG91_9PLEO|nr:hypothetical protein K458DRAFT_384125 [Lentithecium fluviatile CBS 122367]